jgi:Zn-dependent membrane protease YugP
MLKEGTHMFWGFDPTYLLIIPAFVFSLWAQYRVKSAYREWSMRRCSRGMTGAQVARAILEGNGIYDVTVEPVPGHLSDHYDPEAKALRLSHDNFYSDSVAALGVAAHEAGHAVQHAVGYVPLSMRSIIYPLASIGSWGGPVLFMIGLFLAFFARNSAWSLTLMNLGILFFTVALAFYLITLPVEFNASKRALVILEGGGFLNAEELRGARAVLWAAAMTYVAAAAVAASELIRFLILRNMASDD